MSSMYSLCLKWIPQLPARLLGVWRKVQKLRFLCWFLLSVACMTYCVLLGLCCPETSLFFSLELFEVNFTRKDYLFNLSFWFLYMLKQSLLQKFEKYMKCVVQFFFHTYAIPLIKGKKKVMYLMLLFLLYVVFRTIIKAMTGHQKLQILEEYMQMVFLTVRFMLLLYMMNCRWKRCAFHNGGVAAVAAWGLTEGWREQNVICRET